MLWGEIAPDFESFSDETRFDVKHTSKEVQCVFRGEFQNGSHEILRCVSGSISRWILSSTLRGISK